MRTVFLLAASSLALAAAGCSSGPPKVRAALDCPDHSGDLTRTSIAGDGKTCTYATAHGGEVTLQLVAVQGGLDATLAQIEDNLMAGRQPRDQRAEAGDDGDDGEASATATAAAASASSRSAAAKAASEAQSDAVSVDLGSSNGVTTNKGETHVNLPGIHITADDAHDTANVQVGPININASDGAAKFHYGPRDVRLRGEALSPERRGFRATFYYKGDDLPDGYRFVGYEAGGPKIGPFTVAVVKSKASDASRIGSDVTKLVRRNGGV